MTNSIKKTPKRGISCCESEIKDKKLANRKFRKIVKDKIKKQDEIMPLFREVSDVWVFGKDGKIHDKNNDKKGTERIKS
jgi:hypothetical protein